MRTLLTIALCLIGATAVAAGPDQEAAKAEATTAASLKQASLPTGGATKPLGPAPLHQHPTLLKMLKRNNALRASLGLGPHRINAELTRAAQDHAWYMARTGNFSHESNLGPMGRAQKYRYRGLVRENIAWNYRGVASVFQGWQTSSGHWANIISPTVDAGFGYAIAADGSTYWVGMYGE